MPWTKKIVILFLKKNHIKAISFKWMAGNLIKVLLAENVLSFENTFSFFWFTWIMWMNGLYNLILYDLENIEESEIGIIGFESILSREEDGSREKLKNMLTYFRFCVLRKLRKSSLSRLSNVKFDLWMRSIPQNKSPWYLVDRILIHFLVLFL